MEGTPRAQGALVVGGVGVVVTLLMTLEVVVLMVVMKVPMMALVIPLVMVVVTTMVWRDALVQGTATRRNQPAACR